MEESKETKTMQLLDIAPSDATKAFSRALQEKVQGVELKLTEKDQWDKENPVIFICNNNSRIKSDISPIINFIGTNTSKILLVIFHCKTLKRLPVISLKEELKNELPANIEVIEMGFDIHSKSNSIYNCDLNTNAYRRIEDYASENNVYLKDDPSWLKRIVTFIKEKAGLSNENNNNLTSGKVLEVTSDLSDNNDTINKQHTNTSAKDAKDLETVETESENQRISISPKDARSNSQPENKTGNDAVVEKQYADVPQNDSPMIDQHDSNIIVEDNNASVWQKNDMATKDEIALINIAENDAVLQENEHHNESKSDILRDSKRRKLTRPETSSSREIENQTHDCPIC